MDQISIALTPHQQKLFRVIDAQRVFLAQRETALVTAIVAQQMDPDDTKTWQVGVTEDRTQVVCLPPFQAPAAPVSELPSE